VRRRSRSLAPPTSSIVSDRDTHTHAQRDREKQRSGSLSLSLSLNQSQSSHPRPARERESGRRFITRFFFFVWRNESTLARPSCLVSSSICSSDDLCTPNALSFLFCLFFALVVVVVHRKRTHAVRAFSLSKVWKKNFSRTTNEREKKFTRASS